ncbi:DUF262 domain-containing HNH endonuclease family protein [Thiothrix unzii]|jgi:hypothetical protein|uniref:DUF262 domain-containing protein n=1 Tax=Thiothrix unzii TaxID=111769 RepID=UPI002A360990|nr:DUF262 domain-containing HNH endonuclease family protein [Thiothrix unzii]MDX9988049.1 DUF262 domain-containing HNH endonuclease family protein [Thiothrix unzii]
MVQFNPTNVLGFFDSSQKFFEIPVYQRAYSWEKKDWTTFLNDLIEQTEGNNNYFFGNILLETITRNKKYEVIDGQQRITTLSIFFRSLFNVLSQRKNEPNLLDFDIRSKESIFLKNGGNIKIRPVEYDRACYDSLIIDNKKNFEAVTPSQLRIKDAKEFFEKELEKLSTVKILAILEKIETTEIVSIELEGKKDSALMFELENNRGKDLTNMEKLKSYLMYQMYIYSPSDEVETNIEYIAKIFESIYLTINDISSLNEDSILIYHNNAYINGYTYRSIDDVKREFKKSSNKIYWAKNYVAELYASFCAIKKFEGAKNFFAKRLIELGVPAFVYPFIIKGYKYLDGDFDKINLLMHVLEILVFRVRLINSRANIQDRLNPILSLFCGDVIDLSLKIKTKLNESWYWSDENAKNYLNGSMYENNVINYLLWNYERFIQNKGYGINGIYLENEQIEHISPRTPTNGEPIESGYDVDSMNKYTEKFILTRLNSLGNLMLIPGSHNASIGNKPFSVKLSSYLNNQLLNQQVEIQKFAKHEDGNPVWKEDSIIERHNKIVDFSVKKWSFDFIDQ